MEKLLHLSLMDFFLKFEFILSLIMFKKKKKLKA